MNRDLFPKLLGLVLFIITLLTGLWLGNDFHGFFDMPAFLMVFFSILSLMIMKYGNKALLFWRLDSSERSKITKWSGKTSLHVGLFCMIIGLIITAIKHANTELFFPALSVSLLPLFYSYLFYFLVFNNFTEE